MVAGFLDSLHRPVARGVGGGVGRPPPPQLPIPKILFHPLAILFHPWNVDDVTRAMSKGGACECPRGGVFQFFGGRMTSRGQCPRGGRQVFHPSKFRPPPPPHLAGWLRACYTTSIRRRVSYNDVAHSRFFNEDKPTQLLATQWTPCWTLSVHTYDAPPFAVHEK